MSETVAVVAPSDLEAGYTFEATVADGDVFTVTVPEGGVTAGQSFQVPYPPPVASAPDGPTTGDHDVLKGSVTMGRWRVGLCDSCNLCTGLWWMGCCCPSILMGQGMQRLGLDPLGGRREPATNKNSTCTIVTVLTIICSLIYFLRLPFFIFMLIFGTRYRTYMRKKYNIPTQYFGCCEDFCCVFWCTWCMACQTHRQTHDDKQYKYNCCSDTGLDDNAPSVV